MRAEGECPECGGTLGVKVANSIATLMGDTIKSMMDKDGNAMYCSVCDEYKDPENIEVKGN